MPKSKSSSNLSFSQPFTLDIDYWSRSFLALVYPVSLTCIISAILSIFLYDLYTQSNIFEDNGLVLSTKQSNSVSISKLTWEAFRIALIIISIIILATCILVVFVYFGFIRFLYIYLFITILCVFSFLNISILSMIIAELNSSIDWITIIFYIYNISIVAIVSMFWISPSVIKQIITVYQCIIMILYILKIGPEWIVWALLPLLAIWDMIAVLLPFGPLYLLIKLFQKRKIEVPPMMIYTTALWDQNSNMYDENQIFNQEYSSTNIILLSKTTLKSLLKQTEQLNFVLNTNASTNKSKRQTRKSMLGLGDFIFYSILLSKAVLTSQCNLFSIIIIYLSIIMGMFLTTIILVILHRPLPALPISLLIGLIVFFHYNYVGYKFANMLRSPSGPLII